MREDSRTEMPSQRAILTTAPTTTALAFVFERNTIRRRPKRIASTSQPTSIGAGAYVEHAFTVKVIRRCYVTCPVMAYASRDAGLYFVLSANLRPRQWARYFHRLCRSLATPTVSRNSRLSPSSPLPIVSMPYQARILFLLILLLERVPTPIQGSVMILEMTSDI